MTRAAWTDMARTFARLRAKLLDHARHGNEAAHLERVIGVELATRAICRTLRARYPRFDSRHFMRIARTGK